MKQYSLLLCKLLFLTFFITLVLFSSHKLTAQCKLNRSNLEPPTFSDEFNYANNSQLLNNWEVRFPWSTGFTHSVCAGNCWGYYLDGMYLDDTHIVDENLIPDPSIFGK